jgi:hypothetical protein
MSAFHSRRVDREGFAMATTLLIILALTVIAVAAAWMATSEKKTSFAEGVHMEAVYSADAGTEASINFLRLSDVPPTIINPADLTVRNQGDTPVNGDQSFSYVCQFMNKRQKPGWGIEYLDYDYGITSQGEAATQGRSAIQLVASRLFREGY